MGHHRCKKKGSTKESYERENKVFAGDTAACSWVKARNLCRIAAKRESSPLDYNLKYFISSRFCIHVCGLIIFTERSSIF